MHVIDIPKGEYGEFSKIREEFYEAQDATVQNSKVLVLIELSDLYGAIEGFVQNKFGMTMEDLKKFSDMVKKDKENGNS